MKGSEPLDLIKDELRYMNLIRDFSSAKQERYIPNRDARCYSRIVLRSKRLSVGMKFLNKVKLCTKLNRIYIYEGLCLPGYNFI
jgi:hypothetical protein